MVLAEVAEDERFDFVRQLTGDVLACGCIGQMSPAAQNALLDGPGDRTDLEHGRVVVGFEQNGLAPPQVPFDRFGDVAEVSDDGNFGAAGRNRIADGVRGVMGDGETLDPQFAELDDGAGLEAAQLRRGGVPIDARRGEVGQENGQASPLGGIALDERGQSGDVVAVLVGDEDGVKPGGVLAGGCEAFEGLFAAQSGVDQDA